MADKPELLHVPRANAALVVSETCANLITRARKDAAGLIARYVDPQLPSASEPAKEQMLDDPTEDDDPFMSALNTIGAIIAPKIMSGLPSGIARQPNRVTILHKII